VLGQPSDGAVDLADPEVPLVDSPTEMGSGGARVQGGDVLVDVDRDAAEASPTSGVDLVEPGGALAERAAAEYEVVSG
jgi:hypothetical protein